MRIGAQLYTLRDFCQNPEDLAQTLQKVADIGYEYVQVSGTCDYAPGWLRTQLEKTGLKCVLTHIAPGRLTGQLDAVLSEHDTFGCRHIGCGWFGFMENAPRHNYDDFVKTYKPVAEKIAAAGAQFMFHNHAREFQRVDGKPILQKLAEDFSPRELGFTLDTYWVQFAGGDPAAWLEKLSGRVPVIHLKDCSYGVNGGLMAVIGEGNINFDRVFEKAESAGTRYMLVEQDECYGEDPFDCLRRSYHNLKTMGFY